ncbi:helix-turn-helix transcriptional regulator [Cohnella zeiphila]|uniref:helix-turn-helix transcriptional regulator n=1 Tax=Cohnella zeiphila TaxID=2761120 RepID=UPI00192DC8A8|nr:helix-turn-helix transcriptional regulator [Cohnella zeiphila]
MSIDKQKLLGDFLKSRREKLNPSQAELPEGYGRRRTPGLRREEVAQLAHVSTTWYTWLEQGRAAAPSRQVLDNVARALRLSENEHLHLLHLANMEMPPNAGSPLEQTLGEIEKVVRQIRYPAFIATDRTEVLGWNEAAGRVIRDFASVEPNDRSMAWLVFMDPVLRDAIADWDEYARYTVAVVRGRYEKSLDDPAFRRLVDRLLDASPEFAALWATHDVTEKTVTEIGLLHPEAGLLNFRIHSFSQINGSTQAHCCVFIPCEGTDTDAKLRELGIL